MVMALTWLGSRLEAPTEAVVRPVLPRAHTSSTCGVLNDEGWGHASAVIAAIDWAIANKDQYAIRVLNLSLGAPATESYRADLLGQSVERAVAAGLVVVCSAGNFGKT